MIKIINAIIFIGITSVAFCLPDFEENELKLEDFKINISDYEISIGDDITAIRELLIDEFGVIEGPVIHEMNVIGYKSTGVEVTQIEDFPILYSIIISNNDFQTSRGIMVGDHKDRIYERYPMNGNKSFYFYETDSFIIMQQTFYRYDNLPDDNIETYEGGESKTYSITFKICSGYISEIIINQAFPM